MQHLFKNIYVKTKVENSYKNTSIKSHINLICNPVSSCTAHLKAHTRTQLKEEKPLKCSILKYFVINQGGFDTHIVTLS